ncbi:ROK family protein [Mycetocola tolaasinivorans]|uniref:ROK family protein n=1 Tax=Mycetocola tolaasinivorans TaxID=76635 RepID=A0A3L7A4S5_9MICO|nr:ROK family protein [Mycetocola tolaasinivorans]RLP75299.1 ROK family protein [Mycetocola tolaasinivorans]
MTDALRPAPTAAERAGSGGVAATPRPHIPGDPGPVTAPVAVTTAGAGAGHVLQIFRDGSARTKAEIGALTGLARSTVSARVDTLVAAGLLIAAGEAESSGGRPPARLRLNGRARVVIAAELGVTHGQVAVSDLFGTILTEERSELLIADGPVPVLDWVIAAAHRQLAAAGHNTADVLGVGIGVPGPVEHAAGHPVAPPIMPGWDRFDIAGYVGTRLEAPVFVDNDVNLLALGERAQEWPEVQDLVYVKVSTGVGAGIISGGDLRRGTQGAAGDLGHVRIPFDPESGREPTDERDLEALVGAAALGELLDDGPAAPRSRSAVVEIIRAGADPVPAILHQAGRDVGAALATVVSLLNPSHIVVGGSIGAASPDLLAGVREIVEARSITLSSQDLHIIPSRSGDRGGTLGAAQMVLGYVLSPTSIDALTAETASAV